MHGLYEALLDACIARAAVYEVSSQDKEGRVVESESKLISFFSLCRSPSFSLT